jgi:hypothetical protein
VAIKSGPPVFAYVGAPVQIAFTVTEVESDSTARPASGNAFTVSVTTGGGTVNGASTATLTVTP